jgi:hypothetical protein
MYMFKIIQRMFTHMFPSTDSESTKLLMEEADILMKNIKNAKTLVELLHLKEVLKKYRGAVEISGSSHEVKQKLIFLEAQWNRKFRIWKAQG